jgi:hypothetical protein
MAYRTLTFSASRQMALLSEGFESYSDLDKAIKNIESAIKRSNKANGEGEEEVSGRCILCTAFSC